MNLHELRQLTGSIRQVAVTSGQIVQLCGRGTKRMSLVVGIGATDQIVMLPGPKPSVATNMMFIGNSGGGVVSFTREQLGEVIDAEWWINGSSTFTATVIEAYAP